MSTQTFIALILAGGVAACTTTDSRSKAAVAVDTVTSWRQPNRVRYAYDRVLLDTSHAPGATIDSVFPMPEMLRRFRSDLPVISSLRNGAPSKQNLVAQFITALATSDRATLSRLTLSRADYAYVYFPNTPDALRENGLTPQRGWDQITLASEKGIGRALTRLGGKAATPDALVCADAAVRSGAMTLHTGCTVRLTFSDGAAFNGRLFSSIVEFAGRFKFVGYANDM